MILEIIQIAGLCLIKPGAHSHRPVTARFLEIILSTNVGACVYVSASRALITSYMKGMCNNRIKHFYSLSVSL